MDSVQDVDAAGSAVTPESIRVVVYAPDDDLRSWVVEELILMTWIGNLDLQCVTDPLDARMQTADADLLIVGLDRIAPDELEVLRARKSGPVLAIASSMPIDASFDRVLGAKLTSRELKQAIRELVFVRSQRRVV